MLIATVSHVGDERQTLYTVSSYCCVVMSLSLPFCQICSGTPIFDCLLRTAF